MVVGSVTLNLSLYEFAFFTCFCRIYNKLPEVMKKREEEKKRTVTQTNRLRAEVFKKVLYFHAKTNNTNTTVIAFRPLCSSYQWCLEFSLYFSFKVCSMSYLLLIEKENVVWSFSSRGHCLIVEATH